MAINVCVAGASGWVGIPLCQAISETKDLRLTGAVSRTSKGRSMKEITGKSNLDLIVSGSVADALNVPTDVLVDYTKPDIVKTNVLAAINKGVHVVIGTSGLTEDDFAEINQIAIKNKVGVIAAGNFSITAVLLERFACDAAKYISQWEIIDYASDAKMDSPSGTTRELAYRLSEIRAPEVTHPIEKTIGPKESRGVTLNNSQIHSIRLPSYVISVEVIFGASNERLSIRHDSGTEATPYIQGTLLAIRKVREHVGLIRGLDRVIE
jgi:4-hydroxy-tetrahydrodipicolinate reductase